MLSLKGNNISKIPKEALSSLQSLQHLHLDNNNLTQLPKDAFGDLRVVSLLTLSGTLILADLVEIGNDPLDSMDHQLTIPKPFNDWPAPYPIQRLALKGFRD